MGETLRQQPPDLILTHSATLAHFSTEEAEAADILQ